MICWRGKNFLVNHQTQDDKELVEKLLKILQGIGANMSIKVHFLYSNLDKFPNDCGDVSNEQGERFHQDIKIMEECNQGRWDKRINWQLVNNNTEHDRQLRKRKLLT